MNNLFDNQISDNRCKSDGFDLILLASLISITLAKDLTPNEQNTLGNLLMTIGQNLETISGIQSNCISNLNQSSSNNSTVQKATSNTR